MPINTVIKTFKALRATEALRTCGKSTYYLTKDAEMVITYELRSGVLAPNPDSVRIMKNRGREIREIGGKQVLYDLLDFNDWEEIHRFGATDNMKQSTEELLKVQEKRHREKATELQLISDQIQDILWKHYTEKVISRFEKFDRFLEDVNSLCKSESFGKLMFINQIKNKYYDNEKNLRPDTIGENPI